MFQSTHPHGVRQSLRPSATLFHVVSIHAPTRGATSHDCYSPFSVSCFNPRTHTGCDLVVLTSSNNLIIVSIHAPTRGATLCNPSYLAACCCFNPRTHTGCDSSASAKEKEPRVFQSTHPHGVRQNPDSKLIKAYEVSIHAPTRGATVCKVTYYKSIN